MRDLLKEYDLKVGEAMTLLYIRENLGCRQKDVGVKLNIATPNLTILLSKLEKRGVVVRKPIDGRTNGLYLSRSGANFVKNLHSKMTMFETALMEKLPKHLHKPFLEALTLIAED